MALLPQDPAQQKKLLIGILPILLLLGYWYLLHGDRQREVELLESRFERLEDSNATARARASAGGPELAEQLASYERHIDRLEELVPRSEEVARLLNDITLRAHENRVDVARIAPDTKEPGEYYTLETYQVSAFGGYHQLGRFLTAIGSLPRIITPVDVSITERQNPGPNQGALEVNFRIKTYVLPMPGAEEDGSDAHT